MGHYGKIVWCLPLAFDISLQYSHRGGVGFEKKTARSGGKCLIKGVVCTYFKHFLYTGRKVMERQNRGGGVGQSGGLTSASWGWWIECSGFF